MLTTRPVGVVTRRIFLAVVVAQSAIVVTGGLVRLTGSGLGCPTWPECAPGSYVPTVEQAEGIHSYIEFGNRLLTFVLTAVVIAAVLAAWRHRPRRRDLVTLAALQLVGVAVQAALGGITVLTGLHPATVAAHFLLSMVLIAGAVVLLEVSGPARAAGPVRPEIRWLGAALGLVVTLVLVVGTVVTGSGPHSGDAGQPARFGFDPQTVSWLHADLVFLLVGLALAMALSLRLTDAPAHARGRAGALLVLVLAQGAVGYVQYFAGVPALLVALHMVGAGLVVITTVRLQLALGSAPVQRDAAAALAGAAR
jgi:cytochrome c oxidase assembly protein subunit 15